jgi:carboxymethylenebutenolidase
MEVHMGNMVEIKADKVVDAYEATPPGKAKGAIIIIHEVWGLDDHVKSIADRFADAGYIALAPGLLEITDFTSDEVAQLKEDLFTPERRSAVQPQLRKLMAPMQAPDFGKLTTERVSACFNYLYDKSESQQKVAVIGFCFGGSYSFTLAVTEPRLKIAFPFYGHADQPVNELSNIKCPVRAFYGEHDERLMESLPDLKQRMTEAKVDFTAKVYPDCGHAFFNDSNPRTYNQAAADDSWKIVQSELDRVL